MGDGAQLATSEYPSRPVALSVQLHTRCWVLKVGRNCGAFPRLLHGEAQHDQVELGTRLDPAQPRSDAVTTHLSQQLLPEPVKYAAHTHTAEPPLSQPHAQRRLLLNTPHLPTLALSLHPAPALTQRLDLACQDKWSNCLHHPRPHHCAVKSNLNHFACHIHDRDHVQGYRTVLLV